MNSTRPFDVYERTFDFGVRIIKLVDRLPRTLAGIEIGRQLLRSGTSVGANLREADGAESHKDFVHKISISRKEAKESRYWPELLNATILPNGSEVLGLLDEADQLGKILYAMAHRRRLP